MFTTINFFCKVCSKKVTVQGFVPAKEVCAECEEAGK